MPEQLSDAILLERFVSRREEAAFVTLVERHGPLVQRICRRVLRNEHDVEDVFQATFLVLARKASGISWRDSVGGWLGAVAHRLALGARSDTSRQNGREIPMTTLAGNRSGSGDAVVEGRLTEKLHPLAEPFIEVERRELGRVLNDELLRLPDKYRSPLVLCDLEGRTHEEAARQLGYPAGSMSRRLKRAHALLKRRLIHRGVSLAIGGFVIAFGVLGAWRSYHHDHAATLRSAMTSLKPLTNGEAEIRSLVARIDRLESSRECDQIIALTRRATQVAEEIEHYRPGKRPDDWRQYSAEMRLAAGLLSRATRENDPSAMLAAARRLNATCLGCHEVFRKPSDLPRIRSSSVL